MSRRTSPLTILIRFLAAIFGGLLLLGGLLALLGIVSTPLTDPVFLFLQAVLATGLYHGFMWLGHRLICAILLGDCEEYQQFRQSGGDPWFHVNCPPPFNNDSDHLRWTGCDDDSELHSE